MHATFLHMIFFVFLGGLLTIVWHEGPGVLHAQFTGETLRGKGRAWSQTLITLPLPQQPSPNGLVHSAFILSDKEIKNSIKLCRSVHNLHVKRFRCRRSSNLGRRHSLVRWRCWNLYNNWAQISSRILWIVRLSENLQGL